MNFQNTQSLRLPNTERNLFMGWLPSWTYWQGYQQRSPWTYGKVSTPCRYCFFRSSLSWCTTCKTRSRSCRSSYSHILRHLTQAPSECIIMIRVKGFHNYPYRVKIQFMPYTRVKYYMIHKVKKYFYII